MPDTRWVLAPLESSLPGTSCRPISITRLVTPVVPVSPTILACVVGCFDFLGGRLLPAKRLIDVGDIGVPMDPKDPTENTSLVPEGMGLR
jgi:hypothetical protein